MSPVFSILISDVHIHLPFGRNVYLGHNKDKIVFNEQNLFMCKESSSNIKYIYIYIYMCENVTSLFPVLYRRRSWLRPKTELRHRDTVYFGLRTVLDA